MATNAVSSVYGTDEYPNPSLVVVKPMTAAAPESTYIAVMYAKHASDRSLCRFVIAQVTFSLDEHSQCIMVPDQHSFTVEQSDLPPDAEVGVAYARGTIAFAVATKRFLHIYTLFQSTRLPDTLIEGQKTASFEPHSLSLETVTILPHVRSANIGDITVSLSDDRKKELTAYYKSNEWHLL
jgi:hypothetical protein